MEEKDPFPDDAPADDTPDSPPDAKHKGERRSPPEPISPTAPVPTTAATAVPAAATAPVPAAEGPVHLLAELPPVLPQNRPPPEVVVARVRPEDRRKRPVQLRKKVVAVNQRPQE